MRTALVVLAVAASSAYAASDSRVLDAIKNRDKTALRMLLKQKADVNTMDLDGTTPLIWAAHLDDLEASRLLLAAGASPKASNRYRITALAEAATSGDGALIEALVKAGADVSATFGDGETPLMTASRTGSLLGVKVLIAAGAKVNATDGFRGQTALMWAAAENHADVAKVLIDAGADVNARSTYFDFNIHRVAAGNVGPIYSRGGLTALMYAARQGAIQSAKVLIDAGAEIDATEPAYGFTALLDAIYNDHYDFAAFLVERKANMDAGALFLTVEMRNLDYDGNRPRKALSDKLDEIGFVRYLLARGANPNGVMVSKIPPRATQSAPIPPNGNTPFMRAARSADIEIMKLLLEYKADPNKTANDGTTAMMMAANGMGPNRFKGGEEKPEPQFIEAMRLMIEKGANVNAANDRGDTAMHRAAGRGADLLIQFLADHGARLDAKDEQNRTALDVALGVGVIAITGNPAHLSSAALLERLMKGPSAETGAPAAH